MILSLTNIVGLLTVLLIVGTLPVSANGRTEAAATLLQAPSARAAALGEAFSAVREDVSAFAYNPASLYPLENGQASFLYEQGMVEDSFGQLHMGYPRLSDTIGLSIGYYNSGDISVFDGVNQRTVRGQSDLSIGLGYARAVRHVSMGATAKYFKSELAETSSADAVAADVGVAFFGPYRTRIGLSLQNFGTKINYVSSDRDLPRIARLGLNWLVISGKFPTSLLIDSAYHINHNEMRPAVGLETFVGPLAFRAGYKHGSDLEEFSVGTGFLLGRTTFDYAFGLVDELDSSHRVSVSMKFGRIQIPGELVNKGFPQQEKEELQLNADSTPKQKRQSDHIQNRTVVEINSPFIKGARRNKVYIVKEGDTLKSIAKKYFGYEEAWDDIKRANTHLNLNQNNLEVGQKLLLPKTLQ